MPSRRERVCRRGNFFVGTLQVPSSRSQHRLSRGSYGRWRQRQRLKWPRKTGLVRPGMHSDAGPRCVPRTAEAGCHIRPRAQASSVPARLCHLVSFLASITRSCTAYSLGHFRSSRRCVIRWQVLTMRERDQLAQWIVSSARGKERQGSCHRFRNLGEGDRDAEGPPR